METFFLSDTHVSDHGIEFLRNLKSLAGLCLSGTEVTDASLDVLRDLKGLKWVHLGHTRTTEAAQAELRAALPAAEILNVQ
jgi:hypothetical protein